MAGDRVGIVVRSKYRSPIISIQLATPVLVASQNRENVVEIQTRSRLMDKAAD
jgi:hypothetical protein